MKKQTKAIILFIFLGGIMATSTVVIAIPPPMSDQGELMHGYPIDVVPQYCGTGDAKSTPYVKEYKIPTECTQPVAITTDAQGNVWIGQSNTGKIAKFDPILENFTEYDNPLWPSNGRSMFWGMDYSTDNSIWYTDEFFDKIWKFSIDDEEYTRIDYSLQGPDSFPQKLRFYGSQIIMNDLAGGKIVFLDPTRYESSSIIDTSIPPREENFLAGDFDVDSNNNIWYTNWNEEVMNTANNVLVRFDQDSYRASNNNQDKSFLMHQFAYTLPSRVVAPNGLTIDNNDNIWIADTASDSIYKFNQHSELFTRYITSKPLDTVYGNMTGIIQSPISRPYWSELNDDGNLVFTEQASNAIALFDVEDETLVEYLVPSKNPYWSDCSPDDTDCGVAQVLGVTVDDNKIWFTEWVENKIGVIDISKPLPFEIELSTDRASLRPGESIDIVMRVTPTTTEESDEVSDDQPSDNSLLGPPLHKERSDIAVIFGNPNEFDLSLSSDIENFKLEDDDDTRTITVTLDVSSVALASNYKILIGVRNNDVTVSEYVTLNVLS